MVNINMFKKIDGNYFLIFISNLTYITVAPYKFINIYVTESITIKIKN